MQFKRLFKIDIFSIIVLLLNIQIVYAEDEKVAYPEGFRKWAHVKSQIVNDTHPRYESIGGIHHIYANEKAVEGYKTKKFPEGSIIVFDLLEARLKDGSLNEGKRRWIGVMEKESNKYKSTGGWGYENFSGNSKTDRKVLVNGNITNCFSCHQPKAASDYVFSSLRD